MSKHNNVTHEMTADILTTVYSWGQSLVFVTTTTSVMGSSISLNFYLLNGTHKYAALLVNLSLNLVAYSRVYTQWNYVLMKKRDLAKISVSNFVHRYT